MLQVILDPKPDLILGTRKVAVNMPQVMEQGIFKPPSQAAKKKAPAKKLPAPGIHKILA
jgi:hypothetical protein